MGMKILCTELRDIGSPVALGDIAFPSALRVLMMAPHPDDFDSVAMTMRFFQQHGALIHIAVVRTGGGVEDSFCSPPTLEVKARLREEEQRNSVRFFGLPDENLVFVEPEPGEEELLDCPGNTERMAGIYNAFRPDIVSMPHGNDTNIGHRSMYSMFRRIAPRADFPVTAFLSKDPKTIDSRIDVYTPFDQPQSDWKAHMLRCHDSQHQRNLNVRGHGFDERILKVNRRVAAELDLDAPYAEAFELEFYDGQ
jgi:LmbE family N-acetylglucosaminyl deacetylase